MSVLILNMIYLNEKWNPKISICLRSAFPPDLLPSAFSSVLSSFAKGNCFGRLWSHFKPRKCYITWAFIEMNIKLLVLTLYKTVFLSSTPLHVWKAIVSIIFGDFSFRPKDLSFAFPPPALLLFSAQFLPAALR